MALLRRSLLELRARQGELGSFSIEYPKAVRKRGAVTFNGNQHFDRLTIAQIEEELAVDAYSQVNLPVLKPIET